MTAIRFPVEVYLALNADPEADPTAWTWDTDISSKVYVRSGGPTIQRGRANWQTATTPAQCTILLNNRDGRFTRLNPLSPYFGSLKQNTPIRIRINPDGNGYVTRFVGLVSEWPTRWEPSGKDFWVSVRADGVRRRLGRGSVSKSPLHRTYLGAGSTTPIAYWSCEDSSTATEIASGLPGGTPMRLYGAPTLGASGIPGAASCVDLGGSSSSDLGMLLGRVPYSDTGAWRFEFSFNLGTDLFDTFSNVDIWSVVDPANSGTLVGWSIGHVLSSGNPTLHCTTVAGGTSTLQLAQSISTINLFDGLAHHAALTISTNGTSVDWVYTIDGTSTISGTLALGLTKPVPAVERVTANYQTTFLTAPTTTAVYKVGHFAIWDSAAALAGGDHSEATQAYPDELAGERYSRNCAEEGITAHVAGTDVVEMGPQPTGSLFTILAECETASGGLQIERRDGRLGLDLVSVRENATVALALDYEQKHIHPPAGPDDDDLLTVNDVTASNGSATARVVDTASVEDVGRYDTSLTVNVPDADVIHAAGFRVNLGTDGGYRWSTLKIKLHSSSLATLRDDWAAVDIGSRVTIDNLPSNLPPDLVDLIVEGYFEQFDNYEWEVTINCVPYRPYHVFRLASTSGDTNAYLGRLEGDANAAIRSEITSGATSIAFDPNAYRWTTAADDFDPDLKVRLGGEVIEVSSIATTAGTYVAAGAASHADNAAVTPAIYAGATSGDLICVLAAIRSSGTGTLATPTGYTRLPVFLSTDNVQLFAKVHSGSESNPTVTPSGGAAGDTVSAFTFGLRGTPTSLEDLANVVLQSATFKNASAQNIAYPGVYPRIYEGCIVLLLGWKQDDYTSIAVPSGLTEILEASTTTGNDQSLYAAYQIQTTPALVNEGALVVTGGASAISRAAMVALAAGYQTMTVSARSVNGVTKAHSAGTKVAVEDPAVLAL